MRNILSILCTLILPTMVEAATCGLLMAGTVACTNKTKTAMTQTDSIIAPKKKFTRPDDATLRKMLTPEQYAVTQQAATERPFTKSMTMTFREGIVCRCHNGRTTFLFYR